MKFLKYSIFLSTSLFFSFQNCCAMDEFENGGITNTINRLQNKIEELTQKIEQSKTPTGSVIPFAGDTAPEGWLICDGRIVCRSTYPGLFNVIGLKYTLPLTILPQTISQQIIGEENFCVPDLRGRIPVGVDSDIRPNFITSNRVTSNNKLGESGGEEKHKLTIYEMPSHKHEVYGKPERYHYTHGSNSINGCGLYQDSQYTGGDQSHNNMQPYLVLNYIIKY